jgi:hypothetical protein
MKYKIEVTEKDIKRGLRVNAPNCPVGFGLQRKFRKSATVGHTTARVGGKSLMFLPKFVTNWIFRFDARKPVKPFSFTLNIPKAK